MTAKTMAEVLAEHQLSLVWQDADETGITCMCGLDVPTEIERNEIDTQWLAAHQAAALTAAGYGLVAGAKAEALEEAAGEFERLTRIGRTPYDELSPSEKEDYAAFIRQERADWLRARAAEMRQG